MWFVTYYLARLSEELCASQMNEMVAWNQISGLEKHLIKAQSLTQEQAKEIEDLMTKMNWMKQQNIGQHRSGLHFKRVMLCILLIALWIGHNLQRSSYFVGKCMKKSLISA